VVATSWRTPGRVGAVVARSPRWRCEDRRVSRARAGTRNQWCRRARSPNTPVRSPEPPEAGRSPGLPHEPRRGGHATPRLRRSSFPPPTSRRHPARGATGRVPDGLRQARTALAGGRREVLTLPQACRMHSAAVGPLRSSGAPHERLATGSLDPAARIPLRRPVARCAARFPWREFYDPRVRSARAPIQSFQSNSAESMCFEWQAVGARRRHRVPLA
jgi:hypothetical protein